MQCMYTGYFTYQTYQHRNFITRMLYHCMEFLSLSLFSSYLADIYLYSILFSVLLLSLVSPETRISFSSFALSLRRSSNPTLLLQFFVMVSSTQSGSELSTGHFSRTRPDPTRRNVDPTRPAIADKKSDPTRPAVQPFPNMYSFQLNNCIY